MGYNDPQLLAMVYEEYCQTFNLRATDRNVRDSFLLLLETMPEGEEEKRWNTQEK